MVNQFSSPLKNLSEHFNKLIGGRLWLKVLIALALGVVLGILLGPDLEIFSKNTVKTITAWLALPGQVFLLMQRHWLIQMQCL